LRSISNVSATASDISCMYENCFRNGATIL
jgi:hypothetical protein